VYYSTVEVLGLSTVKYFVVRSAVIGHLSVLAYSTLYM